MGPIGSKANVLYAEALLFLDGASRTGESALLMAQALEQTRQVQMEVLNALTKTWPLELASQRFQEKAGWIMEISEKSEG